MPTSTAVRTSRTPMPGICIFVVETPDEVVHRTTEERDAIRHCRDWNDAGNPPARIVTEVYGVQHLAPPRFVVRGPEGEILFRSPSETTALAYVDGWQRKGGTSDKLTITKE